MSGELRSWAVALVLIGMVVVGTSIFIGGMAVEYGQTVDDFSYINTTSEMYGIAENMDSKVEESGAQEGEGWESWRILQSFWAALNMLRSMPDIFISLVSDMAVLLPFTVSGWVTGGIITFALIAILFGFIAAWQRYSP